SATVTGGREIVIDATHIFGLSASGQDEQSIIEIEGTSSGSGVRARFTGGFSPDPYPATAACGTNAVRRLRSLPPGLYTMAQVPAAAPRQDWPSAQLRSK